MDLCMYSARTAEHSAMIRNFLLCWVAFAQPFIKRSAQCYRTVLSVCDVGVLLPNGWMDWDATWYGGRPHPRRHCVRWGPSWPPHERGTAAPTFGPTLLWQSRPSQQLLSSCCMMADLSVHNVFDLLRAIRCSNSPVIVYVTIERQWCTQDFKFN